MVRERIGAKKVVIGSYVTLIFDNGKQARYKIVGLMETDPRKNYISYESPLGAAIFGAKKGEKRKFKIDGRRMLVRVLNIE